MFQTADQENEQRRRLEIAAQNAQNNKSNEDVTKKNKINQKKQQVCIVSAVMLSELSNQLRSKKLRKGGSLKW